MPRFRLNKLVRDKIVTDMKRMGQKPTYHVLESTEHKITLIQKISEEVNELLAAAQATNQAPDAPALKSATANPAANLDIAKEITDLQQILEDLIELYGLAPATMRQLKKERRTVRGRFLKGHFIDSIELPEADTWTAYYRQHPDRFPEIV